MFEQFVVIGSGAFAANCTLDLLDYCIPVAIYEANTTKISTLAHFANSKDLAYYNYSKAIIFNDLLNIKKKTCVFLLGCNYVIPEIVLKNTNLVVINYHNSLLPYHPGRNAEAWAIFEQNSITGITWHFVDEKIDHGDIILQKEISIESTTTSIELLKKQNQLAQHCFKYLLIELLTNTIKGKKQNFSLRSKIHLAKDIPNNGVLDLDWKISKIRAFLNAMDYGALRTLGQPRVVVNNEEYLWKKAEYIDVDHEQEKVWFDKLTKCLFIQKNKTVVKLSHLTHEGK